jgi:hypothetical protein
VAGGSCSRADAVVTVSVQGWLRHDSADSDPTHATCLLQLTGRDLEAIESTRIPDGWPEHSANSEDFKRQRCLRISFVLINYRPAEIGRLAWRNGERGAEWRKMEDRVKRRGLRPRGGWVEAGFVGGAEIEAKVGERSRHPKRIGDPRAERRSKGGQRSKGGAEIQEESGDPRAERRSKGGAEIQGGMEIQGLSGVQGRIGGPRKERDPRA